ncbi:MAG TPA: hypothetical protein VGB62_01635 [Allosphingosinicella sp.]
MAAETAKELLAKLLKRRAEISAEAAALDSLISVYRGLSERENLESATQTEQPELYGTRSDRAFRAAQVAAMMDAARKIIISERRPMKRGELVKRLTEQGFIVTGKDKNKVFGTNLWRSGRFRMVEGEGYWPKDVILPR